MFLGAVLLVVSLLMTGPKAYSGTLLKEGPSPTLVAAPSSPPPVAPSNSPKPYVPPGVIAIVVDSVGDNIGMLLGIVPIPGDQNNVQIVVKPPTVNKSRVYYPVSSASPTPAPAQVFLTVPRTVPVVFCSGADSYDKYIGRCANTQFVSKIIPISLFSDLAAQTPGVTCSPPKAPTYDPLMGTWNCILPPGFF
jgi:hypothetical protein